MICKKCLEDKNKVDFQSDDSLYCNVCIKQSKYLDLLEFVPLIEPVPLSKRKSEPASLNKVTV